MTAPAIYNHKTQLNISSTTCSAGLRKIFAAALVSRQFCQQLLKDPIYALQNGYMGETFKITESERDLIISIQANSLSELASQVNQSLEVAAEPTSGFRNEFNFGNIQYTRVAYRTE